MGCKVQRGRSSQRDKRIQDKSFWNPPWPPSDELYERWGGILPLKCCWWPRRQRSEVCAVSRQPWRRARNHTKELSAPRPWEGCGCRWKVCTEDPPPPPPPAVALRSPSITLQQHIAGTLTRGSGPAQLYEFPLIYKAVKPNVSKHH